MAVNINARIALRQRAAARNGDTALTIADMAARLVNHIGDKVTDVVASAVDTAEVMVLQAQETWKECEANNNNKAK